MFCMVQDNSLLTFDVEFENSNANYQTFQRNIFYISVCNVKATLRYCKENTSKRVISVIAIAILNQIQVFFSLH